MCANHVHHMCSNGFYEGGELSQRFCSKECVDKHMRGSTEGAKEGTSAEREETLAIALNSFKLMPFSTRVEWESFEKAGYVAAKKYVFTSQWTTYEGDCFYDSVCRSSDVPFNSARSLRKGISFHATRNFVTSCWQLMNVFLRSA